ncbi:MAG: hypothetical protein A2Z20_12260 [Bdellovibrionales bacterium RBG_16_40_8]|nr:MAG: hypothetical protein A2Z20_12260 [Bdellovibrionales bacterium RBG_16_40_8]
MLASPLQVFAASDELRDWIKHRIDGFQNVGLNRRNDPSYNRREDRLDSRHRERIDIRRRFWESERLSISAEIYRMRPYWFEANTSLIAYTLLTDDAFISDDFMFSSIRDRGFPLGFSQFRLKILGDGAYIQSYAIQFCNGRSLSVPANQHLLQEQATLWVNITVRCISGFSVYGISDQDHYNHPTRVLLIGR